MKLSLVALSLVGLAVSVSAAPLVERDLTATTIGNTQINIHEALEDGKKRALDLKESIGNNVEQVIGAIKNTANTVANSDTGKAIKDKVNEVKQQVEKAAEPVVSQTVGTVEKTSSTIANSSIGAAIKDKAEEIGNDISKAFEAGKSKIGELIRGLAARSVDDLVELETRDPKKKKKKKKASKGQEEEE